ncbi:hypothetical protein [Pseudarthrobacter sp. B4EP4b]|uniref:hypothetical protein n=1 Tax=Pseudarthrobacter sp. B4EP4b TaxID=2590664 RepID=UPI0015EE9527|nr:hypothetical protein [Pseudarthrobacter sp. B4EP4b]
MGLPTREDQRHARRIGEAGAGLALALGFATPAAGAAAAATMGVAASVHAPNGFFAMEGGLEYPAVLGLAATSFAIGGPGRVSLDALTGHVLDRPWMRAVAVAAGLTDLTPAGLD